MSINAVRLRPFNRKKGNGMRDYKSAHCKEVYRVGAPGQPSPFYIIEDKMELRELRNYSQFEIIPFDDRKELEEFIEGETLNAARSGRNIAPPKIEHVKTVKGLSKKTKNMFAPDKLDEDEFNGGRKAPDSQKPDSQEQATDDGDDEIDSLRKEVRRLQDAVSEATIKGRTKTTIAKWEERLAEANELLSKKTNELR